MLGTIVSKFTHSATYTRNRLNTEISVIRLPARQASKRGKIQRIILMIELGDLRKGILPSDVEPMVAEVMGLRGVKLIGFGTNLSCFGGVMPTEAKMRGCL